MRILSLIPITLAALVGCGHSGSSWPAQPVVADGTYSATGGSPNGSASSLPVTVSNATPSQAHFAIPSLGISVDLAPNQSIDTGSHVIGFDVQSGIGARTGQGHTLTIDGAVYSFGVIG